MLTSTICYNPISSLFCSHGDLWPSLECWPDSPDVSKILIFWDALFQSAPFEWGLDLWLASSQPHVADMMGYPWRHGCDCVINNNKIVEPTLLEPLSPLLVLKKQAAMFGNPRWREATNSFRSWVRSSDDNQQVTEILSPVATRNSTGPTAYLHLEIEPSQSSLRWDGSPSWLIGCILEST